MASGERADAVVVVGRRRFGQARKWLFVCACISGLMPWQPRSPEALEFEYSSAETGAVLGAEAAIRPDALTESQTLSISHSALSEEREPREAVPGGVILEGDGKGIPAIRSASYYSALNALVLDDSLIYFLPVPRGEAAEILLAIRSDDRIGVSLGGVDIVYGSLPVRSHVALELRVVDLFLADIVFASNLFTKGYRFSDGYEPRRSRGSRLNQTVYCNFFGFEFKVTDGELRLEKSGFEVTLVPLSNDSDAEPGHQPDYEGIAAGAVSKEFEENADHLGRNIGYYAQEPLVAQTFAYGEVAALARALKRSGVDLFALAQEVDKQVTARVLGGSVESADSGSDPYLQAEEAAARFEFRDAFRLYSLAAERGNAKAAYKLANALWEGEGTKIDYRTAAEWYQKAEPGLKVLAENGDAEAATFLGSMYHYGRGIEPDYAEAAKWYEAAADGADVTAIQALVSGYDGNSFFGAWLGADTERFGYWRDRYVRTLENRAEAGDDSARATLGQLYLYGSFGIGKNAEKALSLLEPLAERGEYSAIVTLAHAWRLWIWLKTDVGKSNRWYRRLLPYEQLAADNGKVSAMSMLGWFYSSGRGTRVDRPVALGWYHKAAELGDPSAMSSLMGLLSDDADKLWWELQELSVKREAAEVGGPTDWYLLALALEFGSDNKDDLAEAVDLYRRAAELGNAEPMVRLGRLLILGKGVGRDIRLGVKWIDEAAARGSREARNGDVYADIAGSFNVYSGDKQELSEAKLWYSQGAEKGSSKAMEGLGNLSRNDAQGNPIDPTAALHWYRRAVDTLELSAAGGESSDALRLAILYRTNRFVRDEERALYWLESLAQYNDPFALWDLGEFYDDTTNAYASPRKAATHLLRAYENSEYESLTEVPYSFQNVSKETMLEIQKLLADQGFYVGSIDGKLGPLTENALLAFARAKREVGFDEPLVPPTFPGRRELLQSAAESPDAPALEIAPEPELAPAPEPAPPQ